MASTSRVRPSSQRTSHYMILGFNYKRMREVSIGERKIRASLRGDQMPPTFYYDPENISTLVVCLVAARIVLSPSVRKNCIFEGWLLEHFDIRNAFLHERYAYHRPVYIKEMARSDGTYKHGITVWIQQFNLYGNQTGTY